MDEILAPPAPAQPAEAQPDATKEWTAPTLKKLDLTETRESVGHGDDFFLESAP
jgi:hypothetical protein